MNGKKLRARIVEAGLTNGSVAERLGINVATFYRKLKCNGFTLQEVYSLKEILCLNNEQVMEIFFAD